MKFDLPLICIVIKYFWKILNRWNNNKKKIGKNGFIYNPVFNSIFLKFQALDIKLNI